MKKLLFGIFICFASILLMSQNVGAIDFSVDLDSYSIGLHQERQNIDLRLQSDNTFCVSVSECRVYRSTYASRVVQFRTANTYSLKDDDIIVWRVFIGAQSQYGDYTSVFPFIQRNFTTNQDYLVYLGNNSQVVDPNMLYSTYALTPNSSEEYFTNVISNYKYLSIVDYYFRVLKDDNYYIGFDSTNYQSYAADIFDIGAYSTSDAVYFKSLSITEYKYNKSAEEEAAEKDLESTENIENQTPPSSSETGDGAQATNLINAFSGFVSALGGLSATNCNLTLNFPDFAGGSRVVNVCQNKDKAGNIISVFSSLTLIVFYVPLAIRLLTMIYNEIRSFTNG